MKSENKKAQELIKDLEERNKAITTRQQYEKIRGELGIMNLFPYT
jgi:hypothetical protein